MGDGGLPEGFDIRFATEADNDQLVEVSRASAIRLGDARVVVDPGDDYFAAFQLMEEWTVLVVTSDDRVVGVQCACSFPGTFEGEPARISQILHTRFHPDYARMGLWSHLQGRMLAAGRERAASFERGEAKKLASDEALHTEPDDDPVPNKLVGVAYVSTENATVRRLYAGVTPWAAHPFRATIRCVADTAAARVGRPATKDDAEAIAAMLEATRGGQELAAPATPRTVARRLERAPHLYTWDDLLLTDAAVVGVWHSPETRRRTEPDGTTTTSRRALVLDGGFLPGHEEEYEALLRTAASRAAERGYHHLSAFGCDPSPAAAVLRRLADHVEVYDVIVPFLDAPHDVVSRGVYVDQAYF